MDQAGQSIAGPARGCGTGVFKNCLKGIVFMNPETLCDKMYPCLQVGGNWRTVMAKQDCLE
jgi:hypothetical protein